MTKLPQPHSIGPAILTYKNLYWRNASTDSRHNITLDGARGVADEQITPRREVIYRRNCARRRLVMTLHLIGFWIPWPGFIGLILLEESNTTKTVIHTETRKLFVREVLIRLLINNRQTMCFFFLYTRSR